MDFASSIRVGKNRTRRKGIVAKSSKVPPNGFARLWDRVEIEDGTRFFNRRRRRNIVCFILVKILISVFQR